MRSRLRNAYGIAFGGDRGIQKGGIEFRHGKELAGSDDRGSCNEDFMESLELPR